MSYWTDRGGRKIERGSHVIIWAKGRLRVADVIGLGRSLVETWIPSHDKFRGCGKKDQPGDLVVVPNHEEGWRIARSVNANLKHWPGHDGPNWMEALTTASDLRREVEGDDSPSSGELRGDAAM